MLDWGDMMLLLWLQGKMFKLIVTLLLLLFLEGSSLSKFIIKDRCLLWDNHETHYHSEDVIM